MRDGRFAVAREIARNHSKGCVVDAPAPFATLGSLAHRNDAMEEGWRLHKGGVGFR